MTSFRLLTDGTRLTRRRALAWLGGIGLVTVGAACADDDSSSPPTTAESAIDTAPPASGDVCVLTPELTEGPFYLDLDLVRRDISEDRPGVPLALRVSVVAADSCAPLEGAAVDVWHCDAAGAYSGVGAESGETFLRGIQVTNREGLAEVRTIYPGWYAGRAVHIHVKVHVGGDTAHTGQLFFEDDLTARVYEAEPYVERGAPDTPNAADGIFAASEGSTIVSVAQESEGYVGAVTLGVRAA